ncbi:hypothetical protein [Micromonospora avicenniae]|uniref:hypothetical protein n=1 Tax=Micromonospora avicenniae TaxID=1198245 RepID=UPI003327E194
MVDSGERKETIRYLGLLSLARCVPLLHATHSELVNDVERLVLAGPVASVDEERLSVYVSAQLAFRHFLNDVDWQEVGLQYMQNQIVQLAEAMSDTELRGEAAERAFRESSKEIWAACDWVIERSGGESEKVLARLKTTLLGVEYEWQAADERASFEFGVSEILYRERLSIMRAPERYSTRTQIAEAIARLAG